MRILPNAEKLSGICQTGGWQDVARRRFQKGNVRKRGKRTPVWELQWWADYIKPDGSIGRKRESKILGYVSEMTRRQALKAAEESLQPVNSGKQLPHSTLLFEEFVERFFIPIYFPVLKNSTAKRYRITLVKHLLPAFGKFRLCDIRNLDIQQFVLRKLQNGLGWQSADHFRNLMSKIFVQAKKWGHFGGENPAANIELPEKLPVREKHVLEFSQISLLLKNLEEPVGTMVAIGIYSGLRVGEILGMTWKDVDLKGQEIHVRQTIYRGMHSTPKTRASRRTLPLPECLVKLLAFHYERFGKPEGPQLVFATSKGTPFSDTNLLHRFLKPAGQKIGAPWLNWHTLRRTHATLFQQAGGTLREAQAQLGHAKGSTTLDLYTLPIPAAQRATVEKLAQLVTNGDEFAKNAPAPIAGSQQIQ